MFYRFCHSNGNNKSVLALTFRKKKFNKVVNNHGNANHDVTFIKEQSI